MTRTETRKLDAPLGTSPSRQRGVTTRLRLIDAAVQTFSRSSFEKARIEDIIEEAGVSRGTFFHYFPRKEDLLLALAAGEFARVRAALEDSASDSGAGTKQVLEAGFAAIADTAAPPHLFTAVVREVINNRRRFEAMIGEGTPTFIEIMAEVIARGQENGEVRRDLPAAVLAVMVNSMVLSPLVTFPDVPGVTMRSLTEMMRTYLDVLWEGIEPRGERPSE